MEGLPSSERIGNHFKARHPRAGFVYFCVPQIRIHCSCGDFFYTEIRFNNCSTAATGDSQLWTSLFTFLIFTAIYYNVVIKCKVIAEFIGVVYKKSVNDMSTY